MGGIDSTVDEVEGVFSVLGEQDARPAAREVLSVLARSGAEAGADGVAWIEVSSTGRVLTTSTDCDAAARERLADAVREHVEPGIRLEAPASLDLIWITPQPERGAFRAHLIPRSFVFAALDRAALIPLSQTEKVGVVRLVGGTSLKAAAAADGLSFETKRAQLKSALAKLSCSGQLDLVRLVLTQLAGAVAGGTALDSRSDSVGVYLARHLPHCRHYTTSLSTGRVARVLEVGPAGGAPVVMAHGMLFPVLLHHAQDAIAQAGMRLIVPLRTGYLDPADANVFRDRPAHVEEEVDDLAALLEGFLGTSAVVIGASLGATYAVRLARQRPELVSRLVLLSADLLDREGREARQVNAFYSGLRNLMMRPGLLRRLAWQFTRNYTNAATARRVLTRMFAASPSDVRALTLSPAATGFEWFRDIYASSFAGVAEDYRNGFHAHDRQVLASIRTPVLVIHGSDDPMTPLSAVERWIAQIPAVALQILEGGGHLIGATHAATVWPAILKAPR